MEKINMVADENILLLEEFFGTIAHIHKVDGRSITAQQVRQADALVLRSTAQVTADLLTHSQVQFVGTCTIGTDHLDIDYLEKAGIRWANAPGCNAQSVVDYAISAMNHAWQVHGLDLCQQTVGIIGAGNVGGQLLKRLQKAGIKVVCYDPIKAAVQSIASNELTIPLVSLDELLAAATIIGLHTPLTHTGDYPTHGLFNQQIIETLAPNTVLISAGRGEVVDQHALCTRMSKHNDLLLYLDVWQQEPHINVDIMPYCQIVTPHIAGHSLEGKGRGTEMVYQSLCDHFGLPVTKALPDLLKPATTQCLQVHDSIDLKTLLNTACHNVYVIDQDDQRCRHALQNNLAVAKATIGQQFDQLRKTYPERREFSTLTIQGLTDPIKQQWLAGLGFQVSDAKVLENLDLRVFNEL